MANTSSLTSNFPGGFSNGVTIRGVPIVNSYSGTTYWVDSVHGSDGNKGTFDRPFATVAYAVTKVAANAQDLILVKAGHAETVAAAAGIPVSIAGTTIIGLGAGSNRPTFTFSVAASSVLITGANCSIQNILGIAGAVNTNPFNVQAADCYLDFEWQDVTATTTEAARAVLTSAAADRLVVNLKYVGAASSTACINAVRCVGVNSGNINVDFDGVASTAVVEFITTACTGMKVSGVFNNIGTALTKNIVDTVTGSTWIAENCYDIVGGYAFSGGSGTALSASNTATISSNMNVPGADVVTNTLERDVVGNKTDAAVTAVGTTKSLAAYAKGLITMLTVQAPDSANNAFEGDAVGNKSDAAVTAVGTTKSIMAYVKGLIASVLVPSTDSAANLVERDVVGSKADTAVIAISSTASLAAYIKGLAQESDKFATSATATMVNGQTIFTATGDVIILDLYSECITNNDGTASTVQYQSVPTVGAAATFSGASASLAGAAAGASLSLIGTALSTAPNLVTSGCNLGLANSGLFLPAGTIKLVVGVGSTTGTWRHYLRYRPVEAGATVS